LKNNGLKIRASHGHEQYSDVYDNECPKSAKLEIIRNHLRYLTDDNWGDDIVRYLAKRAVTDSGKLGLDDFADVIGGN
jgi:hypothetical protein